MQPHQDQPGAAKRSHEELDAWRQRFAMPIELRSVSLALGLQDVHNILARLTLPEIVCRMVQAVEDITLEQASRLASAYLEQDGKSMAFFKQH